ncbi:MAG: FAD-dependent thymidylate synthase [Acidobacteriota bacterium]
MAVEFVKTGVYPQGMAPCDEKSALRMVEVCGRTAYKSEDKITEDSAASFVLMLKRHGHLSVLEHSNVTLKIQPDNGASDALEKFHDSFIRNLGSRNGYHRFYSIHGSPASGFAVSGSYRGWLETLAFLKDRTVATFLSRQLNRFHPSIFEAAAGDDILPGCRISAMQEGEQLETLKKDPGSDLPLFIFKFVCDRGITHEVVRHRVFSFTQESTRYVNYKNRGMTLILPEELSEHYDEASETLNMESPVAQAWLQRAETLFGWYQEDLERGLRPEIARDILPNLLKSEIFVSGRWSGWKHFIHLRDSKAAHPRIRTIAGEVRRYFESIGLSAEGGAE